jgi:hypothetical protein
MTLLIIPYGSELDRKLTPMQLSAGTIRESVKNMDNNIIRVFMQRDCKSGLAHVVIEFATSEDMTMFLLKWA